MIERTPETNGDLARSRLTDSRLGAVRWVAETGSTNADLVVEARAGASEQVLVADHQTAGRGRLDRRWEVPPGAGLLVSALLRPVMPAALFPLVTVAAGWSMVGAVRAFGADDVTLAWPNDVVVGDGDDRYRKLAGVLSEAVVDPEGTAVIVGCGCNVDLPPGFAVPAANVPVGLSELIGSVPDRAELLVRYLERLARWIGALEADGAGELLGEVRASMWTLGRDVEVDGVRGRAVDLDSSGRLVVETADGAQVVAAGDVRVD